MSQKTQEKRPNIFKRIGAWLGRSWSEFKKVTWPSFDTVMKNLGVVCVIVGLFLVVITAMDTGLVKLLELLTGVGEVAGS